MNTLLKPVYTTDQTASLIYLGNGLVEIMHRQQVISGQGKAVLRLQPRFALSIDAHIQNSSVAAFRLSAGETVDIKFSVGFLPAKAFVTKLNMRVDGKTTFVDAELLLNPQRMLFDDGFNSTLSKVIFHIINFPDFFNVGGSSDDMHYKTGGGGWKLLGRVIINDPPWRIEIQETLETKTLVSNLKNTGGYGITHIGQLERQDGAGFSSADAEKVIESFYLFLSFARGAWTPPILSVGFDSVGNKVYEDWGIRLGTPFESRQGWFDVQHARSLALLYPGFRSLLDDFELGKAVKNALYWYIRSNRGGDGAGIDGGVILSQAALERLGSAYLEANTPIADKNTNAAKILRETLARLGIPSAIDSALATLVDGQQKGYWQDGPDAISRVRNELVHPKNKLPIKIGTVIPDTWNLAQWYFELIILRLAGYNGDYSNRLCARWLGEVEALPWVGKAATQPTKIAKKSR